MPWLVQALVCRRPQGVPYIAGEGAGLRANAAWPDDPRPVGEAVPQPGVPSLDTVCRPLTGCAVPQRGVPSVPGGGGQTWSAPVHLRVGRAPRVPLPGVSPPSAAQVGRQYFGPTNSSRRATDSLLAIETLLRLDRLHSMPSRSSASVKSPMMSADSLVKKYRGYSYHWSPSLSLCRTRLVDRLPSEWTSPRMNSFVNSTTISCCHASSAIVRVCFLPGPCWVTGTANVGSGC